MGVMMDNYYSTPKDELFDGDIEKGKVNVKLGGGFVFDCNSKMRELEFEATINDGFERIVLNNHEERANSCVGSSSDDESECVRLIVVDRKVVEERNSEDLERKVVKEKPKSMSGKKPTKPPRPPKGLSLDSFDQKLIRELHELARLKRARVDRMKALKKGKEAKASSSKHQILATLLTILFCLVLLLHGISSRTSTSTNVQEPPFSSELTEQRNVFSIRHYPVSSITNHNGLGSESPRLAELVSGVDTMEDVSRAVG